MHLTLSEVLPLDKGHWEAWIYLKMKMNNGITKLSFLWDGFLMGQYDFREVQVKCLKKQPRNKAKEV